MQYLLWCNLRLMSHSPPKASPAGVDVVRDQLVTRITEMAPAMRRMFEVRPSPDERDKWLSLTAHQLEALAVLDEANLTMGELCERLDISESAATALSDRLVARGMVSREADPDDRRVIRLSLSEDAMDMVERFRALKRRRIADVLSVLGDADLANLASIHERLLASVEKPQWGPRARAGSSTDGGGS